MGISFVRGAENTLIKQDTVIFDYMKKSKKTLMPIRFCILYAQTAEPEPQGHAAPIAGGDI